MARWFSFYCYPLGNITKSPQNSKKWTMPIKNWKAAMSRFSTMFEEHVTKYS